MRSETKGDHLSLCALINFSGKKTGRSPKDKRIVYEETSKDHVWWGSVNIKMDEHTFEINRERAIDYLNTRDNVMSLMAMLGGVKWSFLELKYAGEMKKGIFSVMHYLQPVKFGQLSLHSSANEGTGKTTLSADPARMLIGDDEHVWSDNGVFNIEGGCYAKCIGLSAEKEPDIFRAIRFGAILENVVYDGDSREPCYDDSSITENTRCAYPIEFIPNAKIPCLSTAQPSNVVYLTCDAYGILPPVSRLTRAQAQYWFLMGYTSKTPGPKMEPTPTFSTCFGQPFIVLHPSKYATMLAERMDKVQANCWLINTGWVGGKFGVGSRCSLKYTRKLIDAIHDGSLAKSEFENFDVFNLSIPKTLPDVPDTVLNPAKAWKNTSSFEADRKKLATMFNDAFKKYEKEVSQDSGSYHSAELTLERRDFHGIMSKAHGISGLTKREAKLDPPNDTLIPKAKVAALLLTNLMGAVKGQADRLTKFSQATGTKIDGVQLAAIIDWYRKLLEDEQPHVITIEDAFLDDSRVTIAMRTLRTKATPFL
ncbi:hypothetical protein H4Q26_004232 [Puccinia striiformis f. sp. tritici PST-130]|nr:hypothetical protein H4Q26_004232 [Puccinia striiformis f. sp. tritici PST-130]